MQPEHPPGGAGVAAIALLDGHGSDGLTMRRLAERLGVTSTALYRPVRTEDDVLDPAFDEIFGEVPTPATWRRTAARTSAGTSPPTRPRRSRATSGIPSPV